MGGGGGLKDAIFTVHSQVDIQMLIIYTIIHM